MKKFMYLYENFLDEKERNKIIVDCMLNKFDQSIKNSLPPKSNIGKEIKRIAKEANRNNHWYFNIDRIESIKIFTIDNDTDNRDMHHHYNEDMVMYYGQEPKPVGVHQKEKKLICFCKINNNSENTSGGNITLINLNDTSFDVVMLAGDMLLFPAYIPFRINPLIKGTDPNLYNERAIYLEAIIRGLSFR